ncbi:tyrosine-type recombinase/integrase [Chelativorans xinjiangense]|uniref:tyrosine-type recombinase/integrase n=1 Tax=Chelativorans xinjiangense TaxID=2681485 RepID=UPI00135C7AE1
MRCVQLCRGRWNTEACRRGRQYVWARPSSAWFAQASRCPFFDLAIDSKLRGCDLVKIKIGTLVAGPEIRARSLIIQQKTGRPVQFEITSDTRASLLAWLEGRSGTVDDFAFPSRVDSLGHLSTRQYARLVDERVSAIGLRREEYGTHSLRRTKASIIYKATGNLRAVQILLGHTKVENTVRYLGVDVEDALELAEATEV